MEGQLGEMKHCRLTPEVAYNNFSADCSDAEDWEASDAKMAVKNPPGLRDVF